MLLIVVCDKGNVLHIVHVLPLVSVACLRLLFMSSIAGPLIPHWDRYRMPFTGGHNTPFSLRHRVGDGGRGYLVTIVKKQLCHYNSLTTGKIVQYTAQL